MALPRVSAEDKGVEAACNGWDHAASEAEGREGNGFKIEAWECLSI